jgi:probable O-glycosylation ligase (exosortase A-associated)
MHDLPFLVFLGALVALGFKRPFFWVLLYAYIDIIEPQRLTYVLLNAVPVSMIAAVLAIGGWIAMDDKSGLRVAPRQWMLLIMIGYCAYTTAHADFPLDARDKWDAVWKALAFAIFLPFTLRTRVRIEALLLFMVLSAATIIIVGGLKTVGGGGGYGELKLMIDNNSGLYEGSTISTVAICIIPIILWFTKYGTIFVPDWKVKVFAWALVFACCLIPVGTSTRTGLLCIVLLVLLKLRDVKRPLIYIGAIAALGVMSVPFLPSAFTERMGTIKTYKGDSSASTRVAVWNWTMDYVKDHPMGGGFQAFRGNHIRYEKVEATEVGGQTILKTSIETDSARAYHSAYFEMLGEQGYFGLALWLLIALAGLFRMEVLRFRYRKAEGDDAWIAPLAVALQSAQIVYMLGAAFIAIAFLPFFFMLIGSQIALDTYAAKRREAQSWRPMRKARMVAAA